MAKARKVSHEYSVGIDLGTTNCCISIFRHGRPETVNNKYENRATTPSWVLFEEGRVSETGFRAKERSPDNQTNTVFNAKRIIGRKFIEPEVQEEKRRMPYQIVNVNELPRFEIREKNVVTRIVAPEEISAEVLKTLKESVDDYLSTSVTKAVITVPASFTDAQRQATIKAGQEAGFEVLQVLNEPTAAAVAYGYHLTKQQRILIFDFGGGTLDVSILRVGRGCLTTLSTAGNMYLGGEDLDELLMGLIVDEFKIDHNVDLRNTGTDAIGLIRLEAAKAKERLSTCTETFLNIRRLHGQINLSTSINRKDFEEVAAHLFLKILEPVETALVRAKLNVSDIDEVILVGGSSRIPKVHEILMGFFPGKTLRRDIDADKAISHGAAIRASELINGGAAGGPKLKLKETNSLTLGVGIFDHSMLIFLPRNTPIPSRREQLMLTAKPYQTSIEFPVYEGEHPMDSGNNLLGSFSIRDLPPMPEGQLQFDVVFAIDQSGLLHVTATNRQTGKFADLHITNRDDNIQKWMHIKEDNENVKEENEGSWI